MQNQLHEIAVKIAKRANKNATRFEIGTVVGKSGDGKFSTTLAGRESNREGVSMATSEGINAGDSIIMLGSGINDANFGLIRSPWITG